MTTKNFMLSSFLAIVFLTNITACSNTSSSTSSSTSSNSNPGYISAAFMRLKESIAVLFDANNGNKVDVAQLQAEQALLKSVGGTVYQVGDYITIVIPSTALFEPGKAALLLDSDQYIQAAADIIRQYPTHNVLVTANQAGLFSKADDLQLSTLQAEHVAAGLFSYGINSNLGDRGLYYSGLGDTHFVADSRYAAGITANRRIQITLYPSENTYSKPKDPGVKIGAY
jgi:outer membrane protein OmpA-like peptidoglycan-associated protein